MGLPSLLQLGLLHISSSFFKHFIYLFIFCYAVFVAACGLSLVGASKGYSLVAVHRLLIAVASLVLEQSLMPLGRTTLTARPIPHRLAESSCFCFTHPALRCQTSFLSVSQHEAESTVSSVSPLWMECRGPLGCSGSRVSRSHGLAFKGSVLYVGSFS